MPLKPIELLPAVARRFVEDMRAFHAEPNAIKADEIAARQLSLPVHDSLVPASNFIVAKGILADQFREQTRVVPRLDPGADPED